MLYAIDAIIDFFLIFHHLLMIEIRRTLRILVRRVRNFYTCRNPVVITVIIYLLLCSNSYIYIFFLFKKIIIF